MSLPAPQLHAEMPLDDAIGELRGLRLGWQREYRNPQFSVPQPTMNFGCIHGGDNPNRICGQCSLEFDLRPLPGMDPEVLRAAIRQKFARAGERTWQARYAYDFAKVGVPGLTAGVVYLKGSDIDTVANTASRTQFNGQSEWERDITVAYVIPEGPLKNLGVAWKNAMWRTDIAGARDQDENRLIVSYSIPLL
jgi:acetylornithine deacetylase/succinyl-diaminopimelate desuccinylase-like protein